MRGLSSLNGTIAREPWNLSTIKNMIVKAIQRTKVAMTTPALQGLVWPPHCRAKAKHTRKPSNEENPGRSGCKTISFQLAGTGLMCPGTLKNSKHIITIGPPRGRLIQKHHHQETSLVKTPPRTGPRMVDTIKTPIQLPINTGRFLGSATTLIRRTDPPRVPAAPNH